MGTENARYNIEQAIREFRQFSRYKRIEKFVFPTGIYRYDVYLGSNMVARLLIDPQNRFEDRILVGVTFNKKFKAIDVLAYQLQFSSNKREEETRKLDKFLYQTMLKYKPRILRAKLLE